MESMKIKIFSIGNGENSIVEEEINKFISDKNVIDIKQSECIEGQSQSYSLTITVLYKENESNNCVIYETTEE